MEPLEERLLKILNAMIQNSAPIRYMDFNKFIPADTEEGLRDAEKEYPELGMTNYKTEILEDGVLKYKYHEDTLGITTLSIIATITDVLIGKRLGFEMEREGENAGTITKAYFYDYNKE
jgi:hypothetical protein